MAVYANKRRHRGLLELDSDNDIPADDESGDLPHRSLPCGLWLLCG
eukprot:COSAG06_NODE_22953_length_707_cov_1.753289_1_plen_45_part_10